MHTDPSPVSTSPLGSLASMEESVARACAFMELMADRIIQMTEAYAETGSRPDIVATGILHISNDTSADMNAAFDVLRHHFHELWNSAQSPPTQPQKSVRKPV